MQETINLLRGNFTILDLGCANASDIIPKQLRKTVTLIETDPLTTSETSESEYFKRITLDKAVSENKVTYLTEEQTKVWDELVRKEALPRALEKIPGTKVLYDDFRKYR